MVQGRIVALLLAWNAGWAAGLSTFRIASVNACLSPGVESHACTDSIDRQIDDGSVLSVTAALFSPDAQGQFGVTGSAQAGYGILHAGISSALNSAGAVMQASLHAQASFEDILTISSPALNGQPGLLYVSYNLSGSGSSSGRAGT